MRSQRTPAQARARLGWSTENSTSGNSGGTRDPCRRTSPRRSQSRSSSHWPRWRRPRRCASATHGLRACVVHRLCRRGTDAADIRGGRGSRRSVRAASWWHPTRCGRARAPHRGRRAPPPEWRAASSPRATHNSHSARVRGRDPFRRGRRYAASRTAHGMRRGQTLRTNVRSPRRVLRGVPRTSSNLRARARE